MMCRKSGGSICVFLAMAFLLIISMILACLEAARYSAAESYAQILLKTATESVLAEYYGPLFADYHIYAIDTGYGNKTGSTDELENKMGEYFLDNVWGFQPERVSVTGTRKLFANDGNEFLEQAAAYEKYTAAVSVADEIIGRVKALGDQNKLKKVLKKRLDIEDELAVIDEYTLDLMRLIDGVDINPKVKSASLEVYSISPDFIKKFFIKEVDSTTAAINNPRVFEKLRGKYINPVEKLEQLRNALPGYAKTVRKRMEYEETIALREKEQFELRQQREEKEKELEALNTEIEKAESEKVDSEKVNSEKVDSEKVDSEKVNSEKADSEKADSEKAELEKVDSEKVDSEKNESEIIKQENQEKSQENKDTEKDLSEKKERVQKLIKEIEEISAEEQTYSDELKQLYFQLDETLLSEKRKKTACEEPASTLYSLCTKVTSELSEVISIIEKIGKKQEKVRPLVEGYEELVETLKPVLSDEITKGLTDSLDLMKAYVGMDNERMDITDFAGILETAQKDYSLMSGINPEIFHFREERTYEIIMQMYEDTEGIGEKFLEFSYEHFVFDYSQIQEHPIENQIAAEFEENVAEGYMSLFLDDTASLSENKIISELLPSLWFETGSDEGTEADSLTKGASDKSGKELLDGADGESSLSDLSDFLEEGAEAAGTKIMSAMYLMDHFKSFREYSSVGDTVMDYELEYILSGMESDTANLASAATEIMLMRLIVTVIYAMTDSDCKAQAEAVAMATMGFTGMPFLVTLVKYLILFLWGTAQAVIETSAILRGKKVPVITNSDSFCLSLPELAVFPALISEKAENIKESQLYLDYNNYLFILLLLENPRKQAARAMDLIQENIRYKYNDDFLMNNAVTGFSAEAVFSAEPVYTKIFSGLFDGKGADTYRIAVEDAVAY